MEVLRANVSATDLNWTSEVKSVKGSLLSVRLQCFLIFSLFPQFCSLFFNKLLLIKKHFKDSPVPSKVMTYVWTEALLVLKTEPEGKA